MRTKEEFDKFLKKLNQRELYRENSYDLFNYNCLTFSNIICNFLCRRDIPEKFIKVIELLRNLKIPRPIGQFLMGTSSSKLKSKEDS
jgi:PPPDE putative peptidase domain